MKKLESLLRKTHKHNYTRGALEEYNESLLELGHWVYILWLRGNLTRDVKRTRGVRNDG